MKKIIILILLVISFINAETFVKRYSYIMECPYTKYDDSYLTNCKQSVSTNSLFIFNYDNTSDVVWKTNTSESRFFYVEQVEATTNDDGDSVFVYNFLSDKGEDIKLVWQGSWLRLVFDGIVLYEFSNSYYNNKSTYDETDM